MEEIVLGTIGSGTIVHSVLDAVAVTPGIRLHAVYSRSRGKGEVLAQKYGAKAVYTELEGLYSDPDVNFIYVASPNSLHYAQTKAALEHGKNVICEKPFCTTASGARELVQLAKEKGLFLVDAVPTAFLPNLPLLKEQIGKIGRLRLVIGNYTQYSSRYKQLLEGTVTNVFDPNFAGGCLQDINFYNVYLNIALFGKPMAADYYPNMADTGVDTSGVMILKYKDFISTNAGSKDARGESFFQIEGEEGNICIPGGSNGLAQIRVETKEGVSVINAQPNPDRWFYEVQELTPLLLAENHGAIDSRLETMVSVIETIETARMAAGIHFPGDSLRENNETR